MPNASDPYTILGISNYATMEEIKTAYRRAVRRLHPDVNPNNPGAVSQMQEVSAAYEVLLDAERKPIIDKELGRLHPERLIFNMQVTPSKRVVAQLSESQVVYVLADITPDRRAREASVQRESRLNLTLVLDHSNSMNGSRMERVKVAAHQIVDQLNPDDILSVVGFNDRAEVVVQAAPATDKAAMKAKISMMAARGGTEIFQGLSTGVDQNRRFLGPRLVNHILLLTDGNTFGDQDRSVKLAQLVAKEGISISAMGLGQEWNDEFLDQIASATGGVCMYISSSAQVVRYLNDHVRNLTNAFAERMFISVAPDPNIKLESVFKLAPSPQPLPLDEGYIALGSMQVNRSISVLFQFEIPPGLPFGFRSVARVVAVGDIMENRSQKHIILSDLSIEVSENAVTEEPPLAILEALSKLTLYRMQERAQEAVEEGDIEEATRQLERLATRLFEIGENVLALEAQNEAQRVASTSAFSDKGKKTLKYQTRSLMASDFKGEDKSE